YRDAVVKSLSEGAKEPEEIRIAAAAFEALQQPGDPRGVGAPKAEAWLARVAQDRNPDGSYGHGAGAARATGGMMALVLRLGGRPAGDAGRHLLRGVSLALARPALEWRPLVWRPGGSRRRGAIDQLPRYVE